MVEVWDFSRKSSSRRSFAGFRRRRMGWRRGSHKTDDRGGSPGAEGPVNGLNKREQEEDERRSLLPPAAKGGMAGKRKRSGRRKVRWNDSDGNKLVEVLEFQPSDSSDSEDEYLDFCVCTVM